MTCEWIQSPSWYIIDSWFIARLGIQPASKEAIIGTIHESRRKPRHNGSADP